MLVDVPGQLADDPARNRAVGPSLPELLRVDAADAWVGDGAAGAIDFTMRCPSCGRWVDIADIDYMLAFVDAAEQRAGPHTSGASLSGSVNVPRPATLSP